jgi:hypothetical protein
MASSGQKAAAPAARESADASPQENAGEDFDLTP